MRRRETTPRGFTQSETITSLPLQMALSYNVYYSVVYFIVSLAVMVYKATASGSVLPAAAAAAANHATRLPRL